MKVTYLGTTTLLFDDGRDQILFDCHITRPSIFRCLFGKLSTDEKLADKLIRTCQIDRLRGIFVSHSHHDHVMDMPYFAKKCNAEVYGTISTVNVALGGGMEEKQLHLFKGGEEFEIGNYKIAVLPSIHSKAHFYNNDLGQTISSPVTQPAKKKEYKEGGSFDFLVEHHGRKYLIRPSYNYLKGQLDRVRADVLFLGIGGMSKDSRLHRRHFFAETIEKVNPELVIPVHWDNFFTPLDGPLKSQPSLFENTGKSLHLLAEYCSNQNVSCVVQLPLTTMDIE